MMRIKIVGAGLAGCEAAYQLLKRGYAVDLIEMRPNVTSKAHKTANCCELVCSNSLKSTLPYTAQGLLKQEMKQLDSLVLKVAIETRVPAGNTLAVDRQKFSENIEDILKSYNNFQLVRKEADVIEDYSIIATGPLSSEKIISALYKHVSPEYLYFYDAVSPIVSADSIDYSIAFYGTRYNKGEPDYLNCPLNEEQYVLFWKALVAADRVILKNFETEDLYNSCMPIEEIARSGLNTMRFGPLRPIGISNNNEKYYAVVQLRKEDAQGSMLNLVGFQTNLKFKEQERVFKMIPGLQNAEFERFGVMHKNTFINSAKILNNYGSLRVNNSIFLAGQIIGVEGYMESAMSGLIAGINMSRLLENRNPVVLPLETLTGSLFNYILSEKLDVQPMNANFGLLPRNGINEKDKENKKKILSERAIQALEKYIIENEVI